MVETETVFGAATIDGSEFRLVIGGNSPAGVESSETGLKIDTGRYNKAGVAKLTVLATDGVPEDVPIEVSIRGTPVFSGTVDETRDGTGDRVRVTAFDAIRSLKQASVFATFDQSSYSRIVETALSAAGVEGKVDVAGGFTGVGGRIQNVGPGPSPTSFNKFSIEFEGTPADEVLEKIAKVSNAAWYVLPTGEVRFTDSIADAVSTIEATQIREVSAGKRSPAYASVRVSGASPVSRRGQESRHLVSSRPITATAGEGDPTFFFEDRDIQTRLQAQNVADKLFERLQAQQRGGYVELVGREDARPFDELQLPESLGGDSYLVDEVTHTLDDSDGYVTRLSLGGVITR